MTGRRQTDIRNLAAKVELFEPLQVSAPLAFARAMSTCPRDMSGFVYGCQSYHAIWQYLRLLEIFTTLQFDSAFFVDVFRKMARAGKHRVLISGTADYGMLAQVLHGFGLEHCTPDVCVVDLCDTPLYINRWYAERVNTSVDTHQANILEHTSQPVDIICTHSFLHNFTNEDRRSLVTKWYQLLRPGGKVVLTNRLRDSDPGLTRRYTPDQANAFQDRVRNAAQAQSAKIDLDPEVLAAMALDFATRRAPFCLPTAQEVRELFEGGGFRIERLSEGVSETGQTLHKTRIYVVATRGR